MYVHCLYKFIQTTCGEVTLLISIMFCFTAWTQRKYLINVLLFFFLNLFFFQKLSLSEIISSTVVIRGDVVVQQDLKQSITELEPCEELLDDQSWRGGSSRDTSKALTLPILNPDSVVLKSRD